MPVYRSIGTYFAGSYPCATCVSMPSEDKNVAAGAAVVAACAWLAATSAAARTAPLIGRPLRIGGYVVLRKNAEQVTSATVQSDEPSPWLAPKNERWSAAPGQKRLCAGIQYG